MVSEAFIIFVLRKADATLNGARLSLKALALNNCEVKKDSKTPLLSVRLI